MRYALGLIGAGNMAEAIVRGVLRGERLTGSQIIASNPGEDRRELFERDLGVATTADNLTVARSAQTLMLCVKPQRSAEVLAEIGPSVDADVLVISIMAGVGSESIRTGLGGGKRRVVRAMPNTPIVVGEGMVAVARGGYATAADIMATTNLFSAAADVMEVTEDQLDAVIAVSGSGPAYFYLFVEAMIAAGVEMGLTEVQAHRLATRTACGAGHMLVAGAESPAELRRMVTSPNGTTHAAVESLKRAGLGGIVAAAMAAAAARSRELGR